MAKMKVGAAGIETISGALKRPKKQNGHNHGNYLIAAHYKRGCSDGGCQRLYSFDADRYKRSTQPSVDELELRNKFRIIRALVETRATSLSTLTRDQEAFAAQHRAGGKYVSFRGWLMGKAYEYWNEQTNTVDWPNTWE